MALWHFKSWTEVFSLDRADFWGSREPGGEPAELDPRQSEPPDVYRTNREVRSIQKPTGEKNVHMFKRLGRETAWIISTKCWCFLYFANQMCVCVSLYGLFPGTELLAGAEGDVWDGRKKQRGSVGGEFVSLTQLLPCINSSVSCFSLNVPVGISLTTSSKQWLGC